jgi:hypothetical protein
MKFPKKLKIAGHEVKVTVTSDIPTMSGNMGDSWNSHNSIRVCSIYPMNQQEETLLHEIIHHILNNLGYTWNKSDGIHTEQHVEAVAQALYQVLRDNSLDFRKENK